MHAAAIIFELLALALFGAWLLRTDWLFGHVRGPVELLMYATAAAITGMLLGMLTLLRSARRGRPFELWKLIVQLLLWLPCAVVLLAAHQEIPRGLQNLQARQQAAVRAKLQREIRNSPGPPRFTRTDLAELIPARDPACAARLIDLSAYYNAPLNQEWQRLTPGNHLENLPRGLQTLGEITFDVRGVIQLAGGMLSPPASGFPLQVSGIGIRQKCRKIHFLHATSFTSGNGLSVGTFEMRYANRTKETQPIVYGKELRDWWYDPNLPPPSNSTVAWQGSNQATRFLALYVTTWTNPHPRLQIETLDYTSLNSSCAPFLIAVTLE